MEAKLSIWSAYYYELSPEEAVEEFIKNGVNCSELSDEHGLELLNRAADVVATGKEFAQFINERNFEISQGHLWLKVKLCSDEDAIDKLCRWIDMYEAIGIKNMVLHCDELSDTGLSKRERADKNIEKFKILAEYIKNKNITVCLENLRPRTPDEKELIDQNADDLLYIIERVGSEKFGICLDTGHLNLTEKNPREFILKAGKKLKALHIADNQGERDEHMMPYTRGTVDFKEVVEALRKVDYHGLFNLEIPGENHIPIKLRNEKIKFIKACYEYLMKL
ncbi:MAG: sugar phosphate isomerase/epimerase [Clostridia bacterium]|nr:sugar phosphate isomerase/epimerase [Clostridia bacterium]